MRKPTLNSLDAFTRAYIEAMAWTEQPEGKQRSGEFYLDRYYYSRITAKLVAKCVEDCAAFLAKLKAEHGVTIAECGRSLRSNETPEAQAGHDFWLTRQGAGCGFWDGDWPEVWGDKLTAIAKSFGETWPCWYKGRMYES